MKKYFFKTDIAFYCIIVAVSLVAEFVNINGHERNFIFSLWSVMCLGMIYLLSNEIKTTAAPIYKPLTTFSMVFGFFVVVGISTLHFEALAHKVLLNSLLSCFTIFSYRLSLQQSPDSDSKYLITTSGEQTSPKDSNKFAA